MTLSRKPKSPPAAPVRCAIYTRKSTEEGRDSDFNSLDAQREAAQAYSHSQNHAGWTCLPTRYDDGGYTYFGGKVAAYQGDFAQSIDIYLDVTWAAPAIGSAKSPRACCFPSTAPT